MPARPSPQGGYLLAEECFAAEDGRFLDCLAEIDSHKWLAGFADKWKADRRPWARAQIFAYLDRPLARLGHEPVVKRLFKDAEARRDFELLGAFLVAFDVNVRRVRRKRYCWDPRVRESTVEEYLATPSTTTPKKAPTIYNWTTREQEIDVRRLQRTRLFSARTRYYLRRRGWRTFRRLGYREPGAYPEAAALVLRRYRDADFASGENILDSWALLQIAFRGCPALEFTPTHHRIKDGHGLDELRAAPRFAEAWQTPAGSRAALRLVGEARARLVRTWAIDLLRQGPVKAALELEPEEVFALLRSPEDEVVQFGAELFRDHPSVARLPVETWLQLLELPHASALALICEAFEKYVSGSRLTLAQVIALTNSRAVPVTRVGFRLLQAREIAPAETAQLADLAGMRGEALSGEVAAWVLARLGAPEHYQLDLVSRFFDSLQAPAREAAWAWLKSPAGRAADTDPVLWSRLTETPFEDLRLRLVDDLARRAEAPAPPTDALAPIWCAVLLSIHRGGRQKLKAVRQIAEAVRREPARVDALLPVLAVAVRSIRGPEARAGLGAVMTLLAARPGLAAAVRRHLPELEFGSPGEVAA